MDHEELIAELSEIEQMTPGERIALAKERRRIQLKKNEERERALPPPPPRRPRLRFKSEIALLEATVRGDHIEVERLLEEGANPNSHNEDGLTSLHQCAIDNNETILRLFLRYGANVNAQDTEQWTPLHAAACCAHIDIVRILIANNANLLAVNADGNMPYDICDDDTTLDLIESEMAARGITQEFIDQERGSGEKRMLDDMKLLHQRGLPLDSRQPDGSTYLHVAAANGYYDVAAFLLRVGVSPLVRDNDLWMPIHAAACWAQPDLIELLCEYGGDINAKTSSGETASDLCEDAQTKAVIETVKLQEARKKNKFGVRDSRRQSRKRKKFESPQTGAANADTPLGVRGTIKRQSLRDKNGVTLARLEAQKEHTDLMRSWSKEDVSRKDDNQLFTNNISSSVRNKENQQANKRMMNRGSSQKQKVISPDEWLRKLDAEENRDFDDDEDRGNRFERGRVGNSTRRKRRDQQGGNNHEMNGMKVNSKDDLLTSSRDRSKKACCCVIS
uniref:ANK_REP_REGION domain-containing protein n=1 Tax=Parastrongyloides trichosuri TaxID=131310 RepID=A0A0N4ZF61_PARTI